MIKNIQEMMVKEGYKLLGKYYMNGEDIYSYIHTETLEFIQIRSEDLDDEILIESYLGMTMEEFDKRKEDEGIEDDDEMIKKILKEV